jgi:prepilin-type N-terminal cleavage/methylation domain-containing protein
LNNMSNALISRERGFTLLELLIIVGILGILAAVIIPNVATFFGSGHLAAANEELRTINTAAIGYRGEHNLEWPDNSNQLATYISKVPTGFYTFDAGTGLISDASGWAGLNFNKDDQKWEKAP